ncbi:MAG: sigma-70 family RNA polymerase sigma factor [Planctomycetes bacterium]|nr:sigma-70 family RNA polymerase sigma factor [Planctomycetota bacterium]
MGEEQPDLGLIDGLFRHQYGRLVAGLTRVFGPARIDLVEDVVQEALLRACRSWPFRGVPEHPERWLLRVARNIAVDLIRRDRLNARAEDELRGWAEHGGAMPQPELPAGGELVDDSLRMIFTCCHPLLSPEASVALTLKTLCGFGVSEIARGLLLKEATVAQRLSRAKAKLQADGVEFAMPAPNHLPARLDAVMAVLYLVFNEGYSAHRGDDLVRHELVAEAIRLTRLLLEVEQTRLPKTHALMALLLLQASRIPARLDEGGELLTLAAQDRARWDRAAIGEGFAHLQAAAQGDELTSYHVEAAIASCHAAAPSHQATDWPAILRHYDLLVTLRDAPVQWLNRAVAVAKVRGVDEGLRELDALAGRAELRGYHLLPATRGMLLWQGGAHAAAAQCFHEALGLAGTEPERQLLRRRAEACARGEAAELL